MAAESDVRSVTANWPLIGRDREVATILGGLRRGVGAVVVGDAGVGKTMLAREVKRRLDADGGQTELVLCSRWSGFPLQPFADDGVERGNAAATILVVDDAHLLDDESADLLWRLAGAGRALVVATVRAGEQVPERVARLWADGACDRLDIAPLREHDVRALLEIVLGGDVEDRLPRLLTNRAAGNALLLRELVRSALASGVITRSHEVWRLEGELPVGAGVAELIRGALTDFDADERQALELLAIAEPLPLDIAHAEIGAPVIDALERRRVVALQQTIDGPVLTLGHPLYGEVIRADIAPYRLRRLRLALIDAIHRAAFPGPREILRSALWRVELGEPADPGALLAAARLARSFSASTAERLARAAYEADRSVEALVLLAETLIMHGRVAETDRLLDAIAFDELTDSDRDAVIYLRAMARTRVGEMRSVAELLTGHASGGKQNPLQMQALYAQALMLDGHIDEAFAAARPLFADPAADPVTRTLVASALVAGGAIAGNIDEAESTMREALPDADKARDVLPFGFGTIRVAASIAVANSGRLDEAEAIGRAIYDEALREDDQWLRPRGASALGVVALGRGLPRTATRLFRIAVASLNEFDRLFLRYNLSFLARGAALAGNTAEARAALQPGEDAPGLRLFEADWEIAEAAVLAAEGAIGAAGEQALRAARRASSMGQWAVAMAGAHDAACYTGAAEAASLVAVAADRVDGPLPPLLSAHAHARVEDDGALLSEVAQRFCDNGWMLFATQAAYAAARAYRAASDGRSAARAAVCAGELHARCEGAAIPWLAGSPSIEPLTRREHEVALLAAAGDPDSEIAVRLAISVRTVQNHLTRAYTKLGVTSRRELPAAFAAGSVEI
jgi:DNA-binding CsgD family transcriptional regulator